MKKNHKKVFLTPPDAGAGISPLEPEMTWGCHRDKLRGKYKQLRKRLSVANPSTEVSSGACITCVVPEGLRIEPSRHQDGSGPGRTSCLLVRQTAFLNY